MSAFYTPDELRNLGLREFGSNVLISRFARIYCAEAISIGHDVRIDDFCILSGGSGITIGNYIHIGAYSALYGASGIELHDFSGISSRVALYSESDDFSGRSLTNPMVPRQFKPGYQCGKIVLERHAAIGTGATILPGVTIGEGTAVGAHSLVARTCEPWSIYFGAPARRKGTRSKELLALEAAFLETQPPRQAP